MEQQPNAIDKLYTEKVLMHGPAFDGSGKIVEREVVRADVTAYRNAGYELGANPTKQIKEVVEEVVASVKKPATRTKKK